MGGYMILTCRTVWVRVKCYYQDKTFCISGTSVATANWAIN
jgi:hypothetical protein